MPRNQTGEGETTLNIHSLIRRNRVAYKIASKVYRYLNPKPSKLEFSIELSTYCNLQCGFCVHEELMLRGLREQKFMAQNTLESTLQFIENVSKTSKHSKLVLEVAGLGEPLLNPNFIEQIVAMKKRLPNASIAFPTNGIFLTESKIQELLDLEFIDIICVSLRFPDRKSYLMNTHSDHYEEVVGNIHKLLELRTTRNPVIHVQIFDTEDYPKAQKYWQKFLEPQDRVYIIPKWDLIGFLHKTTPKRKRNCTVHTWGLTVDVDGYVFPCCEAIWLPWEKQLCLGHVVGMGEVLENLRMFNSNEVERCFYCPR